MNKRIEELWNEAAEFANSDDGWDCQVVFVEKCNKKDPRPDRYSDWEEFAASRKVRECITSIKEHFGVK